MGPKRNRSKSKVQFPTLDFLIPHSESKRKKAEVEELPKRKMPLSSHDGNEQDPGEGTSMPDRQFRFFKRNQTNQQKDEEEDEQNRQLKEIGLFEDGLTKEQKTQLLLMLNESRQMAEARQNSQSDDTDEAEECVPNAVQPVQSPVRAQLAKKEAEDINEDQNGGAGVYESDDTSSNGGASTPELLSEVENEVVTEDLYENHDGTDKPPRVQPSGNMEATNTADRTVDRDACFELLRNRGVVVTQIDSDKCEDDDPSLRESPGLRNDQTKQDTSYRNVDVWNGKQESSGLPVLTTHRKIQKFEDHTSRVPYFTPAGVSSSHHIIKIVEDLKDYQAQVRAIQMKSTNFVVPGDAVEVGRHYNGTLDFIGVRQTRKYSAAREVPSNPVNAKRAVPSTYCDRKPCTRSSIYDFDSENNDDNAFQPSMSVGPEAKKSRKTFQLGLFKEDSSGSSDVSVVDEKASGKRKCKTMATKGTNRDKSTAADTNRENEDPSDERCGDADFDFEETSDDTSISGLRKRHRMEEDPDWVVGNKVTNSKSKPNKRLKMDMQRKSKKAIPTKCDMDPICLTDDKSESNEAAAASSPVAEIGGSKDDADDASDKTEICDSEELLIQCPICNLEFASSKIEVHAADCQGSDDAEISPTPPIRTPKNMHRCYLCKKVYKDVTVYDQHTKECSLAHLQSVKDGGTSHSRMPLRTKQPIVSTGSSLLDGLTENDRANDSEEFEDESPFHITVAAEAVKSESTLNSRALPSSRGGLTKQRETRLRNRK